jgi:hypothetical protein
MKAYTGSGSIDSLFCNFCTEGRRLGRFLQQKHSPWHQLNRMLAGPRASMNVFEMTKKSHASATVKTPE